MESGYASSAVSTDSYRFTGNRAYEPVKRRPLPTGQNVDGRPVYEPPIFAYDLLIGEEYKKKREAVMEYLDGDVVRTTAFLDAHAEDEMLYEYNEWIISNIKAARDTNNTKTQKFFQGLGKEIARDWEEVSDQFEAFGMVFRRKKDGTYIVTEDSVDMWEDSTDSIQGSPRVGSPGFLRPGNDPLFPNKIDVTNGTCSDAEADEDEEGWEDETEDGEEGGEEEEKKPQDGEENETENLEISQPDGDHLSTEELDAADETRRKEEGCENGIQDSAYTEGEVEQDVPVKHDLKPEDNEQVQHDLRNTSRSVLITFWCLVTLWCLATLGLWTWGTRVQSGYLAAEKVGRRSSGRYRGECERNGLKMSEVVTIHIVYVCALKLLERWWDRLA